MAIPGEHPLGHTIVVVCRCAGTDDKPGRIPSSSPHPRQISCANYEARALGIRADMRIAEAKGLCPDIVVVPYLFEKYQVGRNGEVGEPSMRWD